MSIHLHIERLVLDGLPISTAERLLLQTAMETELSQLLRANGLSDELRAGAALAQVHVGDVQVGKGSSPKKLGSDIARAVHQGLGPSRRRQSVASESAAIRRESKSTAGGIRDE